VSKTSDLREASWPFILVMAAALYGVGGGPAGAVGSINVASAPRLEAALSSARVGDTIRLAPGVYANVAIRGARFDGIVEITSSDRAHPAVLTGLTVAASQGLRFKNLELTTSGQGAFVAKISDSRDVHFESVTVHGAMADHGVQLIHCSNVSVENSEFQLLLVAVTHQNCDHLLISGNHFHDIRSDGVHGAGSSWVTISNNDFKDFHRQGDPTKGGDHPDAIQFWSKPETAAAHDIVITGNIMNRGRGTKIEGVFMRVAANGRPFSGVTIMNNTITGETYNAIYVDYTSNLKIAHNTVQPLPDQLSWIRVENSQDVLVTDNSAGKFVFKGVSGLKDQSNRLTGRGPAP